jgi:hypothetical protein
VLGITLGVMVAEVVVGLLSGITNEIESTAAIW